MKYLVSIFLSVFISTNLFAATNYIFAANDGTVDMIGNSGSYDISKDILTIGSDTLGGIHWENRKFYYTTNTLPDPFTNISQVTVVKIWPLTEQEKQDAKPLVVKQLSQLLLDMEQCKKIEEIMDMLENRKPGSKGNFGSFFDND